MSDEQNAAYVEAVEQMNDGEPERAIGAFRRALEKEPDRARIHANLGYALAVTGQAKEGLVAARRGCELAPDDPYALLKRADVLSVLERHEDALADQERARDLAREAGDTLSLTSALNDMGWSLLQLDRSREVLSVAREAIELQPTEASPHGLLAGALADLDRWGEALAATEAGLALEPDNVWLAERRELCAEGMSRLEPMLRAFEEDIGPESTWEQWHELGCVRLACGQLEEAAAAFDEAHLRHPDGDRREEAGMLSTMEADCRIALLERAVDPE